MKKLILTAASLMLATVVSASVFVPQDQRGIGATDPGFTGASTCMITSSTGTAAVLCASGRGVVYGVIVTSTAANDYLTFRDSATANTSSPELARVPNGFVAGTAWNAMTWPKFVNGLSVNASAVPGPGPTGSWTILYRLVTDGN